MYIRLSVKPKLSRMFSVIEIFTWDSGKAEFSRKIPKSKSPFEKHLVHCLIILILYTLCIYKILRAENFVCGLYWSNHSSVVFFRQDIFVLNKNSYNICNIKKKKYFPFFMNKTTTVREKARTDNETKKILYKLLQNFSGINQHKRLLKDIKRNYHSYNWK